jgi:RNA recognition motif-containing protein
LGHHVQQAQAAQAAAIAATAARNAAFQCRIYAGSLHYDTTEADLRTTFSAFGQIRSVTMPKVTID